MFIFQKVDIILKHYGILTRSAKNRITIDNYHVITIDNLPKDYKSIKIEGKEDRLPKTAMGTTIGKSFSAHTNFRLIERA